MKPWPSRFLTTGIAIVAVLAIAALLLAAQAGARDRDQRRSGLGQPGELLLRAPEHEVLGQLACGGSEPDELPGARRQRRPGACRPERLHEVGGNRHRQHRGKRGLPVGRRVLRQQRPRPDAERVPA